MKARLALLLVLSAWAGCAPAGAQVPPPAGSAALAAPALAEADRAAIVEAARLAAVVGDSLWAGWREVPLAILLVTPEREFLVGHPRPSADFLPLRRDRALGATLHHRARVFPPNLLATFPAVGGIPTIVVGRPAETGKGATAWALTILHERFHQLQMSRPGYFEGVGGLGLARGDTTGSWMLDYPFPYDDAIVRGRYVDLASHLLRALEHAGTPDFDRRVERYEEARDRFRESLSADDYRYFQFQLWQEGVARYTELAVAERAATAGEPAAAFRALPGYESYADAAARLRREIHQGLQTSMLSTDRRVAFYPLGAATALLLDLVAPGWRDRYFAEPFALDPYFGGD